MSILELQSGSMQRLLEDGIILTGADMILLLKFSAYTLWIRPFLCRFREGISFPNFVERSILKLPLSKLCAVPFALKNRALFEVEKRAKRCREKGRKGGGKKEKRTRENRSGLVLAQMLNLFKLPLLLSAHLSPDFALQSSFKLRMLSPKIAKGELK